MVILALDTTTRQGSGAVMRGGVLLCEQVSHAGQAHAVHLPADLMTLLESAGLTLADVDAFAVAIGPGAFTGLRVGIATMQGLAFAEGKPLFGVSALDALALAGDPDRTGRRITAWIDAWRGEVYEGIYEAGVAAGAAVIGRPEQFLASAHQSGTLFIGDGAAANADLIRRVMGPRAQVADPAAPPLAGAIATLASGAASAGARPQPDAIQPLYVGRSDAAAR
jgi:tRNA threonylcarbamoyladenosine biosynthesis protein TsaB